jgi:hypothetical protein
LRSRFSDFGYISGPVVKSRRQTERARQNIVVVAAAQIRRVKINLDAADPIAREQPVIAEPAATEHSTRGKAERIGRAGRHERKVVGKVMRRSATPSVADIAADIEAESVESCRGCRARGHARAEERGGRDTRDEKLLQEVQPLATTGALPIGALPAQPAALKRARMAVVAIRNFFMKTPNEPKTD